MTEKPWLRIASYNIHSGVGIDAVFDMRRILEVINEIKPDILAVQEVDTRPEICGDTNPVSRLQEAVGPYISAAASLIGNNGTHYGNLLLSRHPILTSETLDLSIITRQEPRNAIAATINVPETDMPLRIITAHMGLKHVERIQQCKEVCRFLTETEENKKIPTVLMGDINEWLRRATALKILRKTMHCPNAPKTFPSHFPVLALDRIYTTHKKLVRKVHTLRNSIARHASDHLPIYAELYKSDFDAIIQKQ